MAKSFGWYLLNRESAKKICKNYQYRRTSQLVAPSENYRVTRTFQISAAAAWEVPTEVVPWENPTPIGWSI